MTSLLPAALLLGSAISFGLFDGSTGTAFVGIQGTCVSLLASNIGLLGVGTHELAGLDGGGRAPTVGGGLIGGGPTGGGPIGGGPTGGGPTLFLFIAGGGTLGGGPMVLLGGAACAGAEATGGGGGACVVGGAGGGRRGGGWVGGGPTRPLASVPSPPLSVFAPSSPPSALEPAPAVCAAAASRRLRNSSSCERPSAPFPSLFTIKASFHLSHVPSYVQHPGRRVAADPWRSDASVDRGSKWNSNSQVRFEPLYLTRA